LKIVLLFSLILASCGLLPTNSAPAELGKSPTTTQALVDAVPEAVKALTGLVESLIITAIIASLMFHSVRTAVAAMLVAFYQRIENFFKPSSTSS